MDLSYRKIKYTVPLKKKNCPSHRINPFSQHKVIATIIQPFVSKKIAVLYYPGQKKSVKLSAFPFLSTANHLH